MYKVSWIFAVAYAVLSLYLKVCPPSYVLLPFEFGVHLFMLSSLLTLVLLACIYPYDTVNGFSTLHVFVVLETTASLRICDIVTQQDHLMIDNFNTVVSIAIQLGIYNGVFLSETMHKLWTRGIRALTKEEDAHGVKMIEV